MALVTAAGSAAEALEALGRASHDVLISDVGLPGEDGYALLRRVREREAAARTAPVPAIALTAFAREEDRRLLLDAGFQYYHSKPVELDDLIATLRKIAVVKEGAD